MTQERRIELTVLSRGATNIAPQQKNREGFSPKSKPGPPGVELGMRLTVLSLEN
jgi:hypothetical protein